MAVAVEVGGDALVVGPVGGGGAEDESAAEGEGLRCGAGPHEGVQLLAILFREEDGRAERTWHEGPPCDFDEGADRARLIMPLPWPCVQTLAANLRNDHLAANEWRPCL